ncbi:hypothetical protein ACXZ9C_11750 [Streptococcus agalactiae]
MSSRSSSWRRSRRGGASWRRSSWSLRGVLVASRRRCVSKRTSWRRVVRR